MPLVGAPDMAGQVQKSGLAGSLALLAASALLLILMALPSLRQKREEAFQE